MCHEIDGLGGTVGHQYIILIDVVPFRQLAFQGVGLGRGLTANHLHASTQIGIQATEVSMAIYVRAEIQFYLAIMAIDVVSVSLIHGLTVFDTPYLYQHADGYGQPACRIVLP